MMLVRTSILCAAVAAVVQPVFAQQPVVSIEPMPSDATREVVPAQSQVLAAQDVAPQDVALGRAIADYRAGDFEQATARLEEILKATPDNLAATYYLAVVSLRQGLRARQSTYQYEEGSEERRIAASAAGAALERARVNFRSLIERDPQVRFTDAAVDLAIANLADDNAAGTDQTRSLALTREARGDLLEYIRDYGTDDAEGHLFLGISAMRLVIKDDSLRGAAEQAMWDESMTSLNRALELKRQEYASGSREFEQFAAYAHFYRAILQADDSRRDFPGAIEDFDAARRSAQTQGLEEPLQELRATIDRMQPKVVELLESGGGLGPPRISILDLPTGPLEFQGRIGIGNNYDTNVVLNGDRTILPRNIARQDDYTYGVRAGFDISHRLSRQNETLSLGESLDIRFGFDTAHEWHPNIGEFDINQYLTSLTLDWELIPDLYLRTAYDYSYTQLGHSPFISSNRVGFELIYFWPPEQAGWLGERAAETRAYYYYDDRNYLDRVGDFRVDRDGSYHLFGVRQSFNLMTAEEMWPEHYAGRTDLAAANDAARPLRVGLGYELRNETTQGTEFDMYSNGLVGSVDIPLPWRLTFQYDLGLSWDNYQNPSVFDYARRERFDLVQRHGFGIVYQLIGRGEYESIETLEMDISGRIDLTLEDSNTVTRLGERIYEYDRAVYGLSLNIRF